MKVSPGGSLPEANWERAGSKGSELGVRGASWGMLYYVLGSPPPLWGQGVRGAPISLPSLPSPLSIPGSLERPWGLRKPPACSPCSQTIPGSLEPSWGLTKPPARSPCSQSIPGSLEPSWGLRKPPARSACSQSIPGSLEPSWGLRKPPAHSPCSQSIPGSLEPSWGLRKPPARSPCSQLTPLAPSLLPEHPWVPGARGVSWSKLNVILGFRVPTTIGGKTLIIT